MSFTTFLERALLSAYAWVRRLTIKKTYSMAIVRRYTDANGSFVGELYLLGTFMGVLQYQMIGVSLDTLPFNSREVKSFDLDVENDFLVPMPVGCVRVGSQDPAWNDAVRNNVGRIAREGTICLQVQNRFIEHVLQPNRPGKGD